MATSTHATLSPAAVLESLRVHPLRSGDLSSLIALVAGPNLHYLCLAPGHLRRASQENVIDWTRGTVVASLPSGVVAFALIERGPDVRVAQFTIGLDPAFARGPVAARLLNEVARMARALGIERLETQIFRHTTESFGAFREAGLRILASMCIGGVTDVALAVT